MPAPEREVPRGRRPTPATDVGAMEWADLPIVESEREALPAPLFPESTSEPQREPSSIDSLNSIQGTYQTLLRRSGFGSPWHIGDNVYTSTGIRLPEDNTPVPQASLKERCLVCRNRFDLADLNSSKLCKMCAPNYATCNRCLSTLHVREIYDYKSGRLCWNCVNPILPYNTNVVSIRGWRPSTKSTLYYGVELEVSVPKGNMRKHAVHAYQLVENFAIIKSDSSVDKGFEIVSVPATPSKVAALWEPFFKGAAKGLVGYRGNCGMHVHVTRAALTSDTVRKLSVFLNSRDNLRLIEFASSRHLNTYCKQNPYITVDSPISLKAQDRYSILNTTRSDTIEFRSFKSTMRFDHFQRNLEFVGASIEFCGLHSSDDLKYTNFIKFVSASKKYPRLKKAVNRWFKHLNTPTKQLPFPEPNLRGDGS